VVDAVVEWVSERLKEQGGNVFRIGWRSCVVTPSIWRLVGKSSRGRAVTGLRDVSTHPLQTASRDCNKNTSWPRMASSPDDLNLPRMLVCAASAAHCTCGRTPAPIAVLQCSLSTVAFKQHRTPSFVPHRPRNYLRLLQRNVLSPISADHAEM
jgi:hypothetical protein